MPLPSQYMGIFMNTSKNKTHVETVDLVKASDVTPESTDWLWKERLAAGKMHILGGSPGTGKTTICLSLAAILSSGDMWPDGSETAIGNVVIWSGEDGIEDTLVPRLMASGANCDNIHFISGILNGKDKRAFDPASDIEALHRKLEEVGNVRLLIIDPIVSAIQGDSHKNAEVRRGLQPLVELAESLGCALLGVTHFSKNTKKHAPVERLTGSLAFGALARIVLVVSERENEDGSAEYVLCRAKSNIGLDSGGFKYAMQQSALKEYPEIIASSIQWGDAIEGTAQEILSATNADNEECAVLQDAKTYLLEILSDGELPCSMIYEGTLISQRSLQRAKKEVGIKSKKIGNCWYWCLPEQLSQTTSTTPIEKMASLAPLPEDSAEAALQRSMPTVPAEKLEQLKARRSSEIGKMLNQIVARGIQ